MSKYDRMDLNIMLNIFGCVSFTQTVSVFHEIPLPATDWSLFMLLQVLRYIFVVLIVRGHRLNTNEFRTRTKGDSHH